MSGDREAQIQLGLKFEGGEGVEKNLAKALKLYELASKTSTQRFSVYVPAANGGAAGLANVDLITQYEKGVIEQAILRRNSLTTAMAARKAELRDFHNE